MTIKETIQKFLDSKLKIDLIESYEKNNRKASGTWGRTLTEYITESENKINFGIKGEYYTYWMQNGRNPNKDQSPEGLLKFARWAGSTFIKQWIIDKGISANPFAVAYSIAKNGYEPRPLLNFINEQYFEELTKQLVNYNIEKLQSDILKTYKRVE